MNVDILKKLTDHYIRDLQKKEIDRFERAKLLQAHIDSEGISQRELGRRYGISKSTVEDWLLWNNITEERYNALIREGASHTDIYRSLREDRGETKSELTTTDVLLKKLISEVRTHTKTCGMSTETITLLHALRNELNILEMKLEQQAKKRGLEL